MIFSIVHATQLFCPKYISTNATAKEGELCGSVAVGELHYGECEQGLICEPLRFGLDSVCVKYTEPKRLHGEKCTNNDGCWSDKCSNGHCEGHKKDEQCTSRNQCAAELYCDKKCEPAAEDGKPCNQTITCKSNAFCHIPRGKAEGKCYTYASRDVDHEGPVPAACKTYHTDKNGTCVKGYYLTSGKTHCGDYCSYGYNDKEVKTTCTCGRGKEINLCPLGVANLNLEAVILRLMSSL